MYIVIMNEKKMSGQSNKGRTIDEELGNYMFNLKEGVVSRVNKTYALLPLGSVKLIRGALKLFRRG